MFSKGQNVGSTLPAGHVWGPIHPTDDSLPLQVCVLVRTGANFRANPFVLLREQPDAKVFLGAVCDAEGRLQEWVEIFTHSVQVTELVFSGHHESITNQFFDKRWATEGAAIRENLPSAVIGSTAEEAGSSPILFALPNQKDTPVFASAEFVPWEICKDDALLTAHGLPAYSSSPYRYLHQRGGSENKTFATTSDEAPANAHVQPLDRALNPAGALAIFNPNAGKIRVVRHTPLDLESHLQVLSGQPWSLEKDQLSAIPPTTLFANLQSWSTNPEGLPFLLHSRSAEASHLNEIFLLKLSLLHAALKEVRHYVKSHQAPFLNLSPGSFRIDLPDTGDLFPLLWSAKCRLVKHGQSYPLQIRSTEQKYFLRLGRIEPSPFLPEGMGAHSFGIGNAQIRNITSTADGITLEGTLLAEDYLGIDPHDLLWFKLPIGEEKIEFYAHVYKSETANPREARFRTVPAKLEEKLVANLKQLAGTRFPKSPYEIWPLLSSPCDLFSLGVLAVRILLTKTNSNLPVVLDEVISIARQLNKQSLEPKARLGELRKLWETDAKARKLLSPEGLLDAEFKDDRFWSLIYRDTWEKTVSLILRFFPDTGSGGFCKNFGDVTPLALETVFDQPVQELELIILQLRSRLAPTASGNQEIATAIDKLLKNFGNR